MNRLTLFYVMAYCITGCTMEKKNVVTTHFDEAPQWAQEAIWYQIFVERYYNGNTSNNPNRESVANSLIDPYPDNWELTPWTHNWYQQEDWAKQTGLDFYRTIQMRRYGGDLEGVTAKLDYLSDLGITAIYFNPLNDAPSLHKFDARHYHHIDVTFGGDYYENMNIIKQENPADPNTWQWTPADKVFLQLIRQCHDRGMKVIVDFSFNHTGTSFWAFKDILEHGSKSAYKDWYEILSFADSTNGTSFEYDGWFGIKQLPELKKIKETQKIEGQSYEGNMPDAVKKHIFDVCKRWIDPNGDGDPSDGIDGMRLDVAEHVPLGFWRDLRKYVRALNPEFYLVGENWWKKWPDELMDPEPWVRGDVFDAVMHYHWYKPARGLFNRGADGLDVSTFNQKIAAIYSKYRFSTAKSMMNLTSSHDSPRFWTSIANSGKYKHRCKPTEDPLYNTRLVDPITRREGKALLLHQFTMVGAPHIWNGDEMGMVGADDPDNRKPLWWPEYQMDEETPSEHGALSYRMQPKFDEDIFQYYKSMIQLRKSHPALIHGSYNPVSGDGVDDMLLVYDRIYGDACIRVIINTSNEIKKVPFKDSVNIIFNQDADIKGQEIILQGYGGVCIDWKS